MSEPLKLLLPNFIKNLEDLGRSPSTVLAYRADLEQLIANLLAKSRVLPEQVRPDDIREFRDSLLTKKYTPKSVSRKLNAIKTFFRWLIAEKKVAQNPAKDVGHPKIALQLPKFLSQIEYRALRDVVRTDTRIATIVELILQTGMRISEVASLKLENIKDNKLIIEAYATQPQRTVASNLPAKHSVDLYLKERPKSDSPYVFVSKNGKPLAVRNIRAAIDRYMERAGIPDYTVNDLRTTFVVENLKRGVDLVTVSQAVGHKRLSTTERYLELAELKEPGKKQVLEEL
ncbi:hypothetical protein A3F62_02145 [Candidatus Woesebacteria bacterium RIFCSPHIGHO2_12_FULL_44_11]|uniref:Tyrosine recombinase XerC n=1 Tax=Candidatus Woesebacteria bacterium RIFCSPLOWO2_01_FULL_44_14 TaxID=1802525 RepID=A0A1F8BWR2_9BACT|nr:MAG: hypothetical protein A3F62_02145 [Candidatus Woesebacteria bacterium RIFCSPHIGHO2_12_FULL_44_11]OGM68482.1 MAG: hypothetical protein A2975_03105 [Candidatus Woesebacteria bacterium RIFCSPLOWO2_01_FULL_44_14]